MLVMVRAMAPVTGMPPKKGTVRLARPWPISSVLLSVREPVTPSATVAESRLSMAPSTAMVKAEGSSMLMVAMLRVKPWGTGRSVGMSPKRSPMVST